MSRKIFLVLSCVLLVCSCATKTKVEYIDREVVRYETKIQHDTLINNVHDSISVVQKGDTVYVDRWHTAIKERIVSRVDTCWRDSLLTEIKEIAVERKIIPNWCYFSLVVCVIIIIFAVLKLIRWLRIL